MKDGYNREITYMRLSVTDRCNFKCRYCMSDTCIENDSILSFDELYHICECAVKLGIRKIRITGGEPLVRKGIIEFCEKTSKLQGLNELTLTTNGSLLCDMAQNLRKAGVSRLNISLDTLNEDKFKQITQTDKLNEVLSGIKAAKEAGFDDIKINVVLMKEFNVDEIADFIELTKYDDISVRFIELMPIGNTSMFKKEYISADIVLDSSPDLKLIKTSGVAQIYQKDGYTGTIGLIRPMTDKFCDVCNRIRITADGKLKPCLHSHDEYNLRGLSGEQLSEKIKEAISNKPNTHQLTETCFSNSARFMNQIGG